MQYTTRSLLLALATTVLAAPIDNGKRQLDGSSGSLPSLSGVALPTGGLGSSSGSGGLGGLGSSGSGLGSSTGGLGSLPSGLGSSSGGLGGLGSSTGSGLGSTSSGLSGLGSSGGDLSGLGSSSSSSGLSGLGSSSSSSGLSGLEDSSTELTPTTTLKEKRQSLGSLGSLTTGSSSGLGSLGSGSSGLGSLGSGTSGLGSLESGSSSLGSLGSGTSGLGSLESGSSSLGSLGSSGSSLTGTSTSSSSSTSADSGGCKALTFIFARGTGEVGVLGTVIGGPLATALAQKLGDDKVSAQGVDYPADAGGNANLGASGGPTMAKMAQSVLSSCPDSKVVLSGYSQGAMVVHNTLSDQGVDGSKIAAVVAFGDPFNGQAFEGVDKSKVKEFCGSGDGLCSSGGSDTSGSHLSYGQNADAAATFIISATGL